MSRCVFASIWLCIVVAAPPGADAESFRLATINCGFLVESRVHVKFGLDFDPRRWTDAQRALWSQPGFRTARFNEAARAVACLIRQVDADIVALTEVGGTADVERLRIEVAALGLEYHDSAVCDSADTYTGQHVAVLSDRPFESVQTTLPGRESFERELDDPETEDDTGVSKGMQVVFRAAGETAHLFVVHLSSERGGHEQDQQRIAQASIVRRHCLPLLANGLHVIVAGDLNDHRGQPTLRRIRGKDDVFDDLAQTGLAEYFNRDAHDTRWTYIFRGERQQVDHILPSWSLKQATAPGGIRAQTVEVTETIAATGQPVTDHRPLVVTFEWKNQSRANGEK